MTTPDRPLALMAAMPQENAALHALVENPTQEHRGGRDYTLGTINSHPVVVTHSRCGKVASAVTAHDLIVHYNARHIVFTGVAGAIDPQLSIGDIVLGESYVHHDMDARPLFPRFEVPLMGVSRFAPERLPGAEQAAADFLAHDLTSAIDSTTLRKLSITSPKLVSGLVLSGDRFVSDPDDAAELREALPGALCVEMEGAAVAQVCEDYRVGFTSFRTISDTCDHQAPADFWDSLTTLASAYSSGIMQRLLREE